MKRGFFLRSAFLATVLVVTLSLTAFGFKWPWESDDKGEVGITDTEIVIGSHQDLSGPIAGWGVQTKMGLELKVKEINDAGGIHGRKIRLVVEDNAYNPAQAITVTNKMINKDKVFMFIGNMGSPTAGATKPIISKKKIPQMFPLTAASLFFEPYDRYSFGGFVPYYDQARVLTKFFVEERGKKRVGIMYQDDEMGGIMKKGVEDQLATYGMELVAAESYKRGATVFSTQMAKLKKVEADLVVTATVIRETVGALAEAKKLQWDVDMCGMSPAYTGYIPYLTGKAGFSADGYYAAGQSPYIYPDHENPRAREFYKNYKKMFGKAPDLPSTAGYAAIDVFERVAKAVGRDLTREKFIDQLETWREVPDEIFDGSPFTFSPTNHQGADQATIFEIKNNRWVKVKGPLSYKK
ncbi:MAG: ABC transporter substrate-binding protein [Deltaproteobacteria bacterium]|nr:ABC transporter substrate-binding protein [Deltaproteobacteria bacterium]MBT7889529.1 ABC transporter substrate-binding protein [Deltaproteobacteria bacterium]